MRRFLPKCMRSICRGFDRAPSRNQSARTPLTKGPKGGKMHTVFKRRRRWPYWAALAAASSLVVAVATVGSGFAAAKQKPSNISPPRAIGAARVGQVLTGERGTWTGKPDKYEYAWLRC